MLLDRNLHKENRTENKRDIAVYREYYEERYEDLRGPLAAREARQARVEYKINDRDYNPNKVEDLPIEWAAYFDRVNTAAAHRVR